MNCKYYKVYFLLKIFIILKMRYVYSIKKVYTFIRKINLYIITVKMSKKKNFIQIKKIIYLNR